jgi:RNA polymerase sigma-70 factor (ECF subfamily)
MLETNQAATDALNKAGPDVRLSSAEAFDEKAVMARVRAGDKNAFSEIVVQYQNRLYNSIYRMVSSVEDARDICQEVFLKAFQNINSFRGDSAFLTFLYRIAFNESVNYRTRRRKMVTVDFKSNPHCLTEQEINQTSANHAANIQTEDSNKHIQEILNSLDPELKEVVVLKDIECFSYAETAQALNISVSTVRTNLAKAREVLRVKLKDLL